MIVGVFLQSMDILHDTELLYVLFSLEKSISFKTGVHFHLASHIQTK